jgi:hypothetical protein
MMNNPYSLHSWSKDYRAQVMDTARRCDLIERARRKTRGSPGVWTDPVRSQTADRCER